MGRNNDRYRNEYQKNSRREENFGRGHREGGFGRSYSSSTGRSRREDNYGRDHGSSSNRGRRNDGFGRNPDFEKKSSQLPREAAVEAADEEYLTEDSESMRLEGRNAVLEAFRAGRTIDKLFVTARVKDGPIQTILREAKKQQTVVSFVSHERLDQLSESGNHQGVIAFAAAYDYAEVEDILAKAEEKGEPPFLFLLDGIVDPHNLGAIIRTANLAGAHGVIIPKNRAVGLTATVAKASAGALNYTPVARVTNLARTMEDLKKKGLWFVCAAMDGTVMYDMDLKGPIGLVIGSEGEGVSRLVRENCDLTAAIPMKGDIDSLNASVAAGILAYEIVRQRR